MNGSQMTTPIVIQLQELASSGNQNISDLLRKALIVATKLKLHDFKNWVRQELNGYQDGESIPDYRIINGELKAQNPYRGLIPLLTDNAAFHAQLSKIDVRESIPSIVDILSTPEGIIVYHFAPEVELMLRNLQPGGYDMRPLRIVGKNLMTNIVETVKTRILEWALQLEAENILGVDLTFTIQDQEKAMSSKSINIQNFQGVLGDVSGGSISQTNTFSISKFDLESLKESLRRDGVKDEDLSDLEVALQADPIPNNSSAYGPRVSEWIGKMLTKASNGGWTIGISAAGSVLAKAITSYYGLN